MIECWKDEDFSVTKEKIVPVCVKDSKYVNGVDSLLVEQPACISFHPSSIAIMFIYWREECYK